MDDWEQFTERLALLILIGLTKLCYLFAEWLGRKGMHFEFKYRQMVAP